MKKYLFIFKHLHISLKIIEMTSFLRLFFPYKSVLKPKNDPRYRGGWKIIFPY